MMTEISNKANDLVISEKAKLLVRNLIYTSQDGVSDYLSEGGCFPRDRSEKELSDYIAELEAENARLKEAMRWIPVSKRLPDNWESVLTIDISKSTRDMVTAFYNPETSLWSTHFSCDLWVTHWMPLPESPIVYGKESK